jgi:hypothetical protein
MGYKKRFFEWARSPKIDTPNWFGKPSWLEAVGVGILFYLLISIFDLGIIVSILIVWIVCEIVKMNRRIRKQKKL